MTISELIAELEAIKAEHGDLDCQDVDSYEVTDARLCEAEEGEFPEDWNMPAGYKFVQLGSRR